MAATGDTFRLGAYLSDALLNFFFRGVTPTRPTAIYYSLGDGVGIDSAVEISGMVRARVDCFRGAVGGHASGQPYNFSFQSTGDSTGDTPLLKPTFLYLPSNLSGERSYVTGLHLMAFDAASGGNLLFVSSIGPPASYLVVAAGNMLQLSTDLANNNTVIRLCGNAGGSEYIKSMVHDWLFRGYNSLTQLFSVAAYPNVYMQLRDASGSALSAYSAGIARDAGSWAAPAAGTVGNSRRIRNSVPVLSGVASSTCLADTAAHFTVSNSSQGFDNTIAKVLVGSSSGWQNLSVGDQANFPYATIDVVSG